MKLIHRAKYVYTHLCAHVLRECTCSHMSHVMSCVMFYVLTFSNPLSGPVSPTSCRAGIVPEKGRILEGGAVVAKVSADTVIPWWFRVTKIK